MTNRNFAASLVAFLLTVLLGCSSPSHQAPTFTATVARAQSETASAIAIVGQNFPANTTYTVGIWTTGQPLTIGNVTSDGSGNINATLQYQCTGFTNNVIVNVEFYVPGNPPGAAVAGPVKTNQPVCFT
jgi:hypothetical protein